MDFFIPLLGLRNLPTITLDSTKMKLLPVVSPVDEITGFSYEFGFVEKTGFRINAIKEAHGITDPIILSCFAGFAFASAEL